MNIIETNLSFRSLSKRDITNKIILHHPECNGWSIERLHDLHKNQFKWSGIGYHFYVRKDGSIYRGRPEWSIGAHCPGQNAVSISVCLEGNYMVDNMPKEQFNAAMELVNYLKNKYGVTEVGGHKDYYSTDCPGSNFPLDRFKGNGSNNTTYIPVTEEKKLWEVSISGEEVKNLQRELNVQFGAGLKVDGYFGDSTLNACILVKKGANGNITRCIQERLINRGYDLSPYYADGSFGTTTYNAIGNLQKNKGLSADGIVGRNTWKALYSS